MAEMTLDPQVIEMPEVDYENVVWEGEYEGSRELWLRWLDQDNQLLLTGAEAADIERKRVEQERRRAERLAAQLRALGVEPEE